MLDDEGSMVHNVDVVSEPSELLLESENVSLVFRSKSRTCLPSSQYETSLSLENGILLSFVFKNWLLYLGLRERRLEMLRLVCL